MRHFRRHFLTGTVILLPLAVTAAIFAAIINFLTKPFIGLVSAFLTHFPIMNFKLPFVSTEQVLRYGSQLLILVCLFLATLLLGIFARWFLIKAFFRTGDQILHRIPFVNTVYRTAQEVITTLLISDRNSFQQVVMVHFPSQPGYSLGLVSRDAPRICSQLAQQELTSVLIPTTPNPTTGFLVMYPKEKLLYLDITPKEAVKFIVSCGVIIPDKKRSSWQEELEDAAK